MRIRPTNAPVYRLKVTLRYCKPPIWRRFLVPADISLKRLHDAIQAVMGWTDSHLHQFEAGGVLYGSADPHAGVHRRREATTRLDQVLRRPKDRLAYEYDFGDGWKHDLVLEAVLPNEAGGVYPIVEAGRLACPPEDVGGMPGYARFLNILRNPDHPEHEDMVEWIGGEFDPKSFDVRDANLAIHGGWRRGK